MIYTGQKYYSLLDEDMSTLAVEFYDIVYGNVLDEARVLADNGRLVDKNFAGDTINSFNSIANLVPNADKTVKEKIAQDKLEHLLVEYGSNYHSLANFWLVPMSLGRRGKKWNYYDSVDIFLNIIKYNYDKLRKFNSYFDKVGSYKSFCEIHYISSYEPASINEILQMYREGKAEELIKRAINFMNIRAEEIIADEVMCEKLYDYFVGKDLIESKKA